MIEDELRQTELQATVIAKTAAIHQKKISDLVMMIIQDDDDDDSSTDSSSSSDTSTVADDSALDDILENELRRTEIQATIVAKMAAIHQKQMSNLVMMIIDDDNDDDDSSTDSSSSSSGTSTTVDTTVEDDGEDERQPCDLCKEEHEDENQFNRKRIISEGDSGFLPKRLRPVVDHNRVRNKLLNDFLGEKSSEHGSFKSLYGVSVDQFKNIILEQVSKQNHPFYQPEESRNETEPSIEAKLLFPLGALVSGSPELNAAYFEMSEEMALECCEMLDDILYRTFGSEYLRPPADLQSIGHEGRLVLWDKCPEAWHANFEGDVENSPIILKGASDNLQRIWYAESGLEGIANSLRPLTESSLPEQGINPDDRQDTKHEFDAFQSRFQFIQRIRDTNLSFDQVGNRIRTCILLHNMILSEQESKETA